ncbi:MAG TPA: SIMPL domain-containing protein [Gemmataceae bacterium]|nr:SIMPL domain-containing protein [Gemmataceae bacterium]
MKALLASLVALVFAGLATANASVSGTGKVTYVPNLVYVSVGVSSDGKTANEAWQKNEEIVKKLFEVLKKFGIDPKDMKTTGLNISPRYVQHKDQEPELVGYTASYDLSVTVRKLDEAGRVLDGLADNGANRHMNIAFGHSDIEKMMDEARTKAAADARKRAELYVTASGASLGQVLSISEGQAFAPNFFPSERLAKMDAGLPIAAGTQDLSVNVSVVYAINHAPRS